MNKNIIAGVLLTAALAAWPGAGTARAEEDSGPVRELAAGTELPDGTVAGEAQALRYFKANEPELFEKLRAQEPETMRRLYGRYFVWFQRVGNYRKRQKAEMIRQLKNELRIRDLYEGLRRASDPGARAEMQNKLRKSVEEGFESDLAMLEMELGNAQAELQDLKDEVGKLSERVAQRRKARAEIIERRMKELTQRD